MNLSPEAPTQVPPTSYGRLARWLHWCQAALLMGMLFIGAAMLASFDHYHVLQAIHRPLGIGVLLLTLVRLGNRLFRRSQIPPPSELLPGWERRVAQAAEYLLYFLMLALPLVGWGMLSAGRYPVVLAGNMVLPPILPAHAGLYVLLRAAHTLLAYLLFLAVLAHAGAVLAHTFVWQNSLLRRMLPLRANRTGR